MFVDHNMIDIVLMLIGKMLTFGMTWKNTKCKTWIS
jgi:hypothetical protein